MRIWHFGLLLSCAKVGVHISTFGALTRISSTLSSAHLEPFLSLGDP